MTNGAAIGYGLTALKQLGIATSNGLIAKAFEEAMKQAMDEYTEEEAEEVYRNN